MRQKGIIHFFLLLIFAILAFGVGGYYTYKYRLTRLASVTIPATDEASNWKVHTNNVLGISFRYPRDWEITTLQEQKYVVVRAPNTIFDEEASMKMASGAEINFSISPDGYSGYVNSLQSKLGPVPNSDISIINVEKIIINGKEAVKTTIGGYYDAQGVNIKVPYKNQVYLIMYTAVDENLYHTINQILSTFQFIDQETAGDFECLDAKILDCSPCTNSPCPMFYPQYCSKGSAQYNWIIENCPDVKIIGLD